MTFPDDGRYRLRAIWLRGSEPVPSIARRIAVYLDGLAAELEVPAWTEPYSKRSWPASPAAQEEMVAAGVYVEDDDTVKPLNGYSVYLQGVGKQAGVFIHAHAGTAGVGGSLPVDFLELRLGMEGAPNAGLVDPMFPLTITAWEPVMVSFTTYELAAERWGIDLGWRLWLRRDVGSFATVADGLTAVDMEGGTLLKAPEEWSADQVRDAVGATLAANGLREIPVDDLRHT